MVSMGIDGLVSGLDTTSLISQLMQVESAPQALLKTKQSSTTSFVSALQSFNTKVASLADAAATAAKATSWLAYAATSSSAAATVTAGATARPGSLSFNVDKVATTQSSLSAETLDDGSLLPTIPSAITIRASDGTLVTVQPTTGSLSDVAKAVNDAATSGVRATVVRVSNGVNGGEPTYRLQFTGTSTGTSGAFEVYAGADTTGPRLDATQVRAADDASVTLFKGTAAEKSFTQSSNTFANLMTGVDVTVATATAPDAPVTISVARDDAALTKLASGIVGALGVVFSEVDSRTATTTTTDSSGRTVITGGLFTGDSAIRGLSQALQSAASYPVDGFSPSEVGIVIGRDGTFTFDEAKFTSALAADPTKVQRIVAGLAARVADVAKLASDPIDGSLTQKITSQQSVVRDLGDQIDEWDRRLALRKEGLQATYSALEVTLSGLQSQSSWLTSQLASLPTSA
ncbi:flagellar cap protein [Cellulomonas sp. WB94]|uniref:flagellar filament capping protein FliD n=1 Tax=Cellulomonas sp. WB94 TaxID=2173174 RepID=UPI000D57944B|nr:flagellar filament capping protein FliD [Cellulomonas sp. WB94]PVU83378.1 flagellar cap protein [Cellulomonas sp. WB94]